jgi:hypothetical protein
MSRIISTSNGTPVICVNAMLKMTYKYRQTCECSNVKGNRSKRSIVKSDHFYKYNKNMFPSRVTPSVVAMMLYLE